MPEPRDDGAATILPTPPRRRTVFAMPISLRLLGVTAAVLSLGSACNRKAAPPPAAPHEPAPEALAVPAPPRTLITMLASTDTRAYMNEMAAAFGKQHPELEMQPTFAGSMEAATRIIEGKQNPLLFAPADSSIIDLVKAEAADKHIDSPFEAAGEGAPQPLFSSALVLMAWEDRAKVLEQAGGGTVSWKAVHKAVTKGWAALGGRPEWGAVKLDQSDPTQSFSGLLGLASMALEYKGDKRPLRPADLADKGRQSFIAAIEHAVPRFPRFTEAVMVEMLKLGPAQHDLAVMYESSVVGMLEGAARKWGKFRVYYPTPTLSSNHPIGLVHAAAMSPKERAGALAWIEFLRGPTAQARALAHGLRPIDANVSLTSTDSANPFHRLREAGLRITPPPAVANPDVATIHKLVEVWTSLGLAR
jgi:ABC-type molybdate transport system substrate-binding protein